MLNCNHKYEEWQDRMFCVRCGRFESEVNMKVFNVTLMFNGSMKYEIEATDDESAEDIAVDRLYSDVRDVTQLEVIDAVVVLSDNQYTAEQELLDDEHRHENKR